ncbi:unnamed protein product [Cladocopium goreaui]|uniref:Crinkler effector protein 15 n=1 Tax=Cladocopium goreaui TaxID=2562237 RepID=A0A9P1DQT2_9DINO|nr:unnamed protein product [Cladocopium goreaui]
MCDLGYDKGVSDNMAKALSFYSPSALVEASRESLLGALQQTFPDDAQRMIMAQSLYDRIQKGITQPQPVQSDVPENVKAFARALDDAELEGQILRTETGSFKLQNVSEIWDEKQFYVELKDFPVFLHQRDIIHLFQKGKEPKEVDVKTLRSAPAQALYIMDADIDVEHGVFCQSLWITSARRPETAAFNTEHFKKAERFSGQCFMPPWTLTEMLSAEVMALHKLNEEVVKERFGIFGGTARLVLERDETRAENDKERLVEAVQSADALQSLKVSSDMKAISKTTHLLVKMHPKREFSWFDVQLSSPYVRQELVKQNRQDNSEELWKRMRKGIITGIGFALFEEEFHQFMQDKSIGKFKLRARCLTAEGKGSDTTQELQGGLEGVLISGNPAADIKDGEYYQPQSKNFPAFDSWTSQGVFQLTIADTHDITFNDSGKAMDVTKTQASKIVDALCKKHDSKAKFFFVVPQFQFDKWKTVQTVKQPEMAEKIEQWVVCFEQRLPQKPGLRHLWLEMLWGDRPMCSLQTGLWALIVFTVLVRGLDVSPGVGGFLYLQHQRLAEESAPNGQAALSAAAAAVINVASEAKEESPAPEEGGKSSARELSFGEFRVNDLRAEISALKDLVGPFDVGHDWG